MPPPKSEARQIAIELCRKHPEHAARGLARMLQERVNGAMTLDACRSMIRKVFGAHGKNDTKHAEVPRGKRKPGQQVKCPPSIAKPWEPHEIKCKRLGIVSDIHNPFHAVEAVEPAFRQLKASKIDHLLLNGDIFDCYPQSFHERRPSKRNFRDEKKHNIEFLRYIRKLFPKIPITFKLGNHEERWYRWLWEHAPEIGEEPELSFEQWYKCDELDIDVVEDQRIIMAGKLAIAHGHELGKGMTSPVNPARGAFLRTLHTILVGHHHRTSGHCESNMWHDETFVWSTGCLCDMTPEYARINKWNWGFAQVDIERGGEFQVTNYRIAKNGNVRAS